jgi:outer membrane lipoprotein-sorting protein
MSFPKDDNELHAALAEAFTPPPPADFDAWQRQHSQAVAHLNPQRAIALTRRRRVMSRAAVFVTTAVVLICAWLGVSHFGANTLETAAFAQTLEQIHKARTMAWKTVFYEHITSRDEKQTWLHTGVIESFYKSPGLYRNVRLDDNGKVTEVQITDTARGRRLTYSPSEKKATISEFTPNCDDQGPFASTLEDLNAPNLQWVGKRKTAVGEANVFRHTFRWYVGGERDYSYDFWIDAKTKQLVALYAPGADVYDPEHDPSRNAPPGKEWCRRAMCGSDVDIRYDVPLDSSLFRLEPPQGYAVEIKSRDRVTEKEMIDYFGIVADFNDKTFPDEAIPVPWNLLDKIDRASRKPQKDQTVAERKLLDTDMRYGWRFGTTTSAPISVFFSWDSDRTVEKSFRYIGKGVKLGDKNRIVCWYKLKDAKDPNLYRVLYGDLSVKDVVAKDLPLPVGP